MARRSKYPGGPRARGPAGVRAAGEHESQWAAIASIAAKIGCTAETLRKWVRQAERDRGQAPGIDDDERERLKELERENPGAEAGQRDSAQGVGVFRAGGARPPTEVMIAFIDDHRASYGVEPICALLPIAPSTYYAHQRAGADPGAALGARRSATTRCGRDPARLDGELRGVRRRKVWRQFGARTSSVARCTVERLMRAHGPAGRGAWAHVHDHDRATTRRAARWIRVNRQFTATDRISCGWRISPMSRPGAASSTSRSSSTCSRAASSAGGSARRCTPTSCSTRWSKRSTSRVRDADGSCITAIAAAQYLSIRYTERLADAGIEPSVGSVGDSYDNALAETIIGLYKTEVIHRRGPWRISRPSNSRRSNGSTGSTTVGCSNRSATSRRPNSKQRTISQEPAAMAA